MDRNTITGLLLVFIIMGASVFFLKPSDEEIKKEQERQAAAKQIEGSEDSEKDENVAVITLDSAKIAGPFGRGLVGEEKLITLENELIKAQITTKGGRIKSVELKNEVTHEGDPLYLFDGDTNKFGLLFTAGGKSIITQDYFFETNDSNVSVQSSDSSSVTLRLHYDDSRYIDYIYSLKGNSYNLGFTIQTKGLNDVVAPTDNHLVLNWETALYKKEKSIVNERERSTVYYRVLNDDVDNLSSSGDDEEVLSEDLQWVSFKQHFFTNVLQSKFGGFKGAKLNVYASTNDSIVKLYSANMNLPFLRTEVNSYPMNFFFGPNQYKVLKDEGIGLEKQVNMGWGPMRWINQFITVPVFNFLDGFNLGYGVVILILTILLKLALSPLTYKSYVSMAKMRVLKPEMDAIKKKHGEDNPTLLQQEYMKLYKQAGVNPLGGCMPLLLQMPFTIAFFFFFPNLFELRGESFLWVKDLASYDYPISFPPIPILGVDHISLMCVLMTITTLISTWYNNSVSGATGQMKYIGYFMPLIFFFILNSFPAGLNYYYLLSTIFTFGQQFVIRQFIDDSKILAIIENNKKRPEAKKKSKFQERMEEYMRQQQNKAKN